MWQDTLRNYVLTESYELIKWAKCGDSLLSTIPTALWAMGTAALAHRVLSTLFRRSLFRRVPLWETMLQQLLFIWMVLYSLYFWAIYVKIVKIVVEYCYQDLDLSGQADDVDSQKLMQQWVIWVCGVLPLAVYIHTMPKPQPPPLMIWFLLDVTQITTNPWHRREMGPHGYYLNRPLSSLQSTTNVHQQAVSLRKAFSDSKITLKEPPKKKRYSKSI